MDCVDIDWKKIKAEYIAGGTSYRKLAEKYGVSRSKLQAKATREKWVDLQSQAQAKTEAKIVDMISDQDAKNAIDIAEVADKLLTKISTLVDSVYDADSIKKLSSAIKDLKDIKGIKSDADMREQEARIAKLQKEAQEEQKDNNEIKIVIGSEAEEYSE